MFRKAAARFCVATPSASFNAAASQHVVSPLSPSQAPPLSSSSSPSRSWRWLRRIGWTCGALGGAYVVTDVATDRSLTRSLRTVATFLRIAAMYKFTTPNTPEEYRALNAHAAALVLGVCLKNEGLYIKLGQGLNAMSHILPKEYTDALSVLLDRAPPVPMRDVERTILHATGASSLRELFVDFDEVPIASASIAQVHRAWVRNDALTASTGQTTTDASRGGSRLARKHDGATMVAVKVRKPSIDKQSVWDTRTYAFISYLLQAWFHLPTGWARETVVDALYREMDFTIEERNALTIKQLMAERSDLSVYVPYIYSNWTAPSLLVMEWVDGTKIADVTAVRRDYANPSDIIKTVFNAFGEMVFRDGFVHCDPHGANVLVRPKRRHGDADHDDADHDDSTSSRRTRRPSKIKEFEVVFIDFGLCAPLTEKFRMEYALFLKSIFTGDMTLLREVVTSWGVGNSEVFASMQMQKPLDSMRRGEYGEVTKEEVARMQRMAHTKVKSFLSDEEKMPKELPMVVRGFEILRGINRLYGSPVNRMNMLMQGAMKCLGPLHNYADVQRYLARLDARRQGRSSAEGATNSAATSSASSSSSSGRFRSVYDADATRLREEQAAAAKELADSQTWDERLVDFLGTLYRVIVFRLVMCHIQLVHSFTYWYNKALDTLGASPQMHVSTLEDRAEQVAQSL